MRLVWAYGIENRQVTTVLPCLQASFEDVRGFTGGSRPPILRLHSDRAKELLAPSCPCDPNMHVSTRSQTNIRVYDATGNGLAERWVGITKVRATALLADVRLPPEYWSYAW